MSDTSQEKTEEATPRQLRKARERGQVAKSAELSSAAVLATGIGMIAAQAAVIGDHFRDLTHLALRTAARPDLNPNIVIGSLGKLAGIAMQAIMPMIIAMAAVALFVSFMQVGALLTLEPLKPSLQKLNVLAGLKKMFFSGRTYIELLKAIVKIAVISLMSWNAIKSELPVLLQLGRLPVQDACLQSLRIISRCSWQIIMFFAAIAVLDFFYQRWQHGKELRMSRQQVREEYKEQEGDPHNKHQRQRMHHEIVNSVMIAQTEKADVVVTNPTHIACALRYDPKKEGAPRLIAKGTGWVAQQIKEIAAEKDIPVVRDISLARALNELELETLVPEELYDAVAELLKWIEIVAAAEGRTPAWTQPAEAPDAEHSTDA